MIMHKKIQELKLRAKPVNYSHVSVNERGQLSNNFFEDLDKRIVSGYLLVWGSKNMHNEIFIRGCCAKSISDRGPNSTANYKITFLNQHNMAEPLCVFAELVEDQYGLRFTSKPLDAVPWADYLLVQFRSGTINQFSAGFNYVWDKIEYDEAQDAIICKEIDLFEGSAVTIGSELNTMVIRSAEQQELFFDELESFVKTLPRKNQLQARQYFSKLKSLIDDEPFNLRSSTLETDEPAKESEINYDYLIKNL